MKPRTLLPVAIGAALLFGGCSSTGEDEEVELNLPSQAESDAAAAKRIHAQNADDEMKKLEQEISSADNP